MISEFQISPKVLLRLRLRQTERPTARGCICPIRDNVSYNRHISQGQLSQSSHAPRCHHLFNGFRETVVHYFRCDLLNWWRCSWLNSTAQLVHPFSNKKIGKYLIIIYNQSQQITIAINVQCHCNDAIARTRSDNHFQKDLWSRRWAFRIWYLWYELWPNSLASIH